VPAAQAALTQAEDAERAANQHNDEVAAQLAVAQANEQRALEAEATNQAKLEQTQATLDNFAADLFQGGGGGSQMSVALGATSADDFATRVVLADQVGSLTDNALKELENARAEASAQEAYLKAVEAEVAQLKREAEDALAQAKAAREAAATAKANLDALLAQQAAYAAQVEAKKADEEKRLAAAEAEQARLQAVLEAQARAAAAAEAARAAAARAAGRAYTPVTGGTGFLSRAANGPITSPFGLRYHPILHVWKLHSGTDFAVACGTPVYAAADGTVISAGYGGGNGNRIVVDHGIVSGVDLASTYNHLTSFVVRSGKVKRGQLIAYSGTTGYSTGCHLHFETLENGQFVNPMKWL
jgi:murein DD-endopeptidase MepM/ murein hydrolase activator NlpD